jgi:hypothetical protein
MALIENCASLRSRQHDMGHSDAVINSTERFGRLASDLVINLAEDAAYVAEYADS